MKQLIDTDPLSGIETWHEYDHAEKKTRIYYVPTRDLTPAIDFCKQRAADDDYTKAGMKEEFWHYGWTPASLQLKWLFEEGIPLNDAEAYNRKLNQPEFKYLKTTAKYHPAKDSQIFLPK